MNRQLLILTIPLVLILVLLGAYTLRPAAEVPEVPAAETVETATSTEEATEPAPAAAPALATLKTEAAASVTVAPQTATMIVEGTSFPIRIAAGSTIEEAMRALKEDGSLSYETRTFSGLGAMVEEIQGKASTREFAWILHVNGKKSGTGISQTRISSGDLIEWKYERTY